MKFIRLFTITSIILFFITSQSFGQIAFDVKTLFQEKSQLRYVKTAVINYLQNSSWATVKEYGENYSLWITNFKRISLGDSIKSEFDIDIRTPAMISHGEHIVVMYDTVGISKMNFNSDTLITNMIVGTFESAGLYSGIMSFLSSSNPAFGIIFQMFKNKFIAEFKRVPTPLEQLEANVLGAKTVIVLQNIFKNNRIK